MADKLPVIIDKETLYHFFQNALVGRKPGAKGPGLNESILRSLRIMDEQDAVNSFVWYNLPDGLSANLIERILYYRGSGMFFYMKENDMFYFLPYVGSEIDVYGRYKKCSALPFNGTASEMDKDAKPWIDGKFWDIKYDMVLPEKLTIDVFTDSCAILNDYSRQMSQKVLPRYALQEPLLNVMSEIIPFLRTTLLSGCGIKGIRVNNQDEAFSVAAASASIQKASIFGEPWIPIDAGINAEQLTDSQIGGKVEDYLVSLQSLDNLRLSMHGLENGGLFQKKAHMLQSEEEVNQGSVGLVMQDKLYQRQEFCNIINSIWGLGMWCDVAEVSSDADMNGDGVISDEDTTGNEDGLNNGSEESNV